MSLEMPGGHALVVGGTGMLRGVCLDLARRGWHTSVVARGHAGLGMLADAARSATGTILPLPADYHDSAMLAARIRSAIAARGPISLAVCWIHSSAPDSLALVARQIANPRAPSVLLEVAGSAALAPGAWAEALEVEGVVHRRVVLGFVREDGFSRWLTNDEIALGVSGALEAQDPLTVVGIVEPWSQRPR